MIITIILWDMNLVHQVIQIRENFTHVRREVSMLVINEIPYIFFNANMRTNLENVPQSFIKPTVSPEINLVIITNFPLRVILDNM